MQSPNYNETDRLRIVAEQTRLRAIETELNLVMTWCSLANTEVELGETAEFQKLLSRIKRAAESLRRHINDPAHVPTELVSEFRAKLKQLELKLEELEDRQQI